MKKVKALIVEDNAINALVLRKAIQGSCDPVHVVNDQEAYAALESETYQIVFMDINLGSKSQDGETIMRHLKEDPRYEALPIVAVTSYAMPGDKERFLKAGFDAYLAKPIQREEVLKELGQRLGESASKRDGNGGS